MNARLPEDRDDDGVRRVLVVAFEDAELLDISCVVTTLQFANHLHERRVYRPIVASPGGRPVKTATGLVLNVDQSLERVRGPFDTLVVSGGLGYVRAMEDARLIAHLRRLARETKRVASVCTGAGLLAAAGLLDGRRAATHWDHAQFLSAKFPEVEFDSAPIFIAEPDLCTSAGVTAALDLSLAFIEADVGAALARDVARQLVVYLQRPGNQAQMSMFTAPSPVTHDAVRDTVDFVSTHLDRDLSAPALARRAGVSERHLSRLFLRALNVTPGRYVRRARVEAAAHLLSGSDLPIDAVARRCGFGSVEALRQAFVGTVGVSPSHFRATQSHTSPSASSRHPSGAGTLHR